MKLIIDAELAQAILNYLQGKPFSEVHQLINALLQSERIEEEPQEAKAE